MASPIQPEILSKTQKLNLLEIASTPITDAISDSVLAEALKLQPFIPVPGALNMRDLGQIPSAKLKSGLIFRSGNLHNLPASSIPLLSTQLKIRTLFDLRQIAERERDPDPELPGINTIHLPCSEPWKQVIPKDFASNGGVDGYIIFYDEFLRIYVRSYKRILEHLRDHPDEPILFHCSSGKDRTGILAAIILTIAGHNPDEVAHDYVLSRIGVETKRLALLEGLQEWLGDDALEMEGVVELASTKAEFMEGFLEFMERGYGGVLGYCRDILDFSQGDLDGVRGNILA